MQLCHFCCCGSSDCHMCLVRFLFLFEDHSFLCLHHNEKEECHVVIQLCHCCCFGSCHCHMCLVRFLFLFEAASFSSLHHNEKENVTLLCGFAVFIAVVLVIVICI